MAKHDITIAMGKTLVKTLRWEAPPIIYRPITGITQSAPVTITCPTHGVPTGWRVAVVSVKGMTDINAENTPPKAKDYHKASAVDGDTLTINDINSSGYKAYTTGGYVQYNTPVDMTGFTARMQIKDRVGGTVLLDVSPYIALDNSEKKITITIPAAITEAITFTKGVYDLEMASPAGVVTELLSGSVVVTKEVTT
jgi:hypothetical protein